MCYCLTDHSRCGGVGPWDPRPKPDTGHVFRHSNSDTRSRLHMPPSAGTSMETYFHHNYALHWQQTRVGRKWSILVDTKNLIRPRTRIDWLIVLYGTTSGLMEHLVLSFLILRITWIREHNIPDLCYSTSAYFNNYPTWNTVITYIIWVIHCLLQLLIT